MPPGHRTSQQLLNEYAEDVGSSLLQATELLKAAEEYITGARVSQGNVRELYHDIHGHDPEGHEAATKVLSDVERNIDAVVKVLTTLGLRGLQPVKDDVLIDFINRQ